MALELTVTEEEMMDLSTLVDDEEIKEKQLVIDEETENIEKPGPSALSSIAEVTIFDVFGLPKDIDVTKKWHDDVRLNVVHVYGVDEMSSDDVLAYFKEFNPSSIEWINDKSCNIVFDDFKSSAKALTELTSHLLIDSDDSRISAISPIPLMKVSDLEVKVPDGHKFVRGKPTDKAKILLLRFALSSDKKVQGAGKFSQYYQKYGNPHYGGKKNIMSSSLSEKLKAMAGESLFDYDMDGDSTQKPEEKEEPKPKKPPGLRMKMRADDEEEKVSNPPRKSVFERLDKTKSSSSRPSVLDRLGVKSGGISKKEKSGLSVWSRLSLGSEELTEGKRTVIQSNIRKVR